MEWIWIIVALALGWSAGYSQGKNTIKNRLEEAGIDPNQFD